MPAAESYSSNNSAWGGLQMAFLQPGNIFCGAVPAGFPALKATGEFVTGGTSESVSDFNVSCSTKNEEVIPVWSGDSSGDDLSHAAIAGKPTFSISCKMLSYMITILQAPVQCKHFILPVSPLPSIVCHNHRKASWPPAAKPKMPLNPSVGVLGRSCRFTKTHMGVLNLSNRYAGDSPHVESKLYQYALRRNQCGPTKQGLSRERSCLELFCCCSRGPFTGATGGATSAVGCCSIGTW